MVRRWARPGLNARTTRQRQNINQNKTPPGQSDTVTLTSTVRGARGLDLGSRHATSSLELLFRRVRDEDVRGLDSRAAVAVDPRLRIQTPPRVVRRLRVEETQKSRPETPVREAHVLCRRCRRRRACANTTATAAAGLLDGSTRAVGLLAQILVEVPRAFWVCPVAVRHGVVAAVVADLALHVGREAHL